MPSGIYDRSKSNKVDCICAYCKANLKPRYPNRVPKSGLTFCGHEHRALYFAPILTDKFSGENGPMYGKHHSQTSRDKMSESHKGKQMGSDNSFYGKHHTEETKEIIRNSVTMEERRNRMLGEKNPMFGTSWTEEQCKMMSKRMSGENNPNFGGKYVTDETRNMISKANIGRFVGDKSPMFGKFGSDSPSFGRIVSEQERRNISKRVSGEGNPMFGKFGDKNPFYGKYHSDKTRERMVESWVGGFWYGAVNDYECEILSQEIRQLTEYLNWRKLIYKRDNFTDFFTGEKERNLEAHHLKPLSIIIKENNIYTLADAINCKELWDINNGITIFKRNHTRVFHTMYKESVYVPEIRDGVMGYAPKQIYPSLIKVN